MAAGAERPGSATRSATNLRMSHAKAIRRESSAELPGRAREGRVPFPARGGSRALNGSGREKWKAAREGRDKEKRGEKRMMDKTTRRGMKSIHNLNLFSSKSGQRVAQRSVSSCCRRPLCFLLLGALCGFLCFPGFARRRPLRVPVGGQPQLGRPVCLRKNVAPVICGFIVSITRQRARL